MKRLLSINIFLLLFIFAGYAQVANVSYSGPQSYSTGTAIPNLSPTISGGTVPNKLYSQVSTYTSAAASGLSQPNGVATDASGNLYVADYGHNVIRKITPGGVVSVFAGSGSAGSTNSTGTSASFNGPTGVATDGSGNVYVADANNNMIRKITPGGVVSTFAGSVTGGTINANGTSASFNSPTGVATDAAGNVYVADFGNSLIRMITPSGNVTLYAGNLNGSGIPTPGQANGTGTAASFKNPYAIASDAAGNLYVADQGNFTIRKITPAGGGLGTVTTLAGTAGVSGSADGTGAAASFSASLNGLVADSQGNIFVADAANLVIREISPAGVVSTFAGAGSFGASPQDGIGTASTFLYIGGMAINAQDDIFFSDNGNNNVRKVLTTGFYITPALPAGLSMDGTGTISGTPTAGSPLTTYTITAYNSSGASVPATVDISVFDINTDATLSNLTASTGTLSPAFAASSTVYVLNVSNTTSAITLTPTVTQALATVKVKGSTVPSGSPSGAIALTTGSNTIPVVVTAKNGTTTQTYTVYVVRASATLLPPVIAYAGPQTYTVGTPIPNLSPTNTGGAIPAGAYATVSVFASSGFTGVNGTAVDAQGNVYVADQGGNKIEKITSGGTVSVFAGSGSAGLADGTGAAASFSAPQGVATDAQGNVYVADFGNNTIRKITPAGVVTTYAGSPYSVGNADGPAASATFSSPTGVAVDLYNNVYVADYGNGSIRKINPEGVVSTLATGFNGPYGVATDANGNVYVAENLGNTIKKVTPGGAVSLLAGSGSPGSANATGAASSFSTPSGVAVDAQGNVFVADANNGSVRKITPAGVVTRFATGGLAYDTGIAIDAQGTLFVADAGSNNIRKVPTTGYTISPTLSAGLTFDASTGTISGTPTAAKVLTTYTITAYNASGTSTFKLGILVNTANTDATLSNLTLSTAALKPVFAPAGISYTAVVSSGTTSIILTPTTNNAGATLTVGGVSSPSGTGVVVPLITGANTVNTVVTAADGTTTMTYKVIITKGPSTNANLSGLTSSVGTLSPVFAAGTISYTASVTDATTSMTVTPTTAVASATVTVNGVAATSASPSNAILLNLGTNTIPVVVTAQDGTTTKTYTLVVTVTSTSGVSNNANLSNISLSSGTLSPIFASGTTSYTANVSNATSSITLTPTTSDVNAVVTVNGNTVASGAPSTVALNVGLNIVTAVVTAQDGSTTNSYTVNITRAAALSNDASLSSLAISAGTLSPAFASGTISYATAVNYSVSSVTVTPTATDLNATIMVNGSTVSTGVASTGIPLSVGLNTINTVVTAQDGVTTITYTINITRAAASNNSNLSNITLSTATLSPVFASGTLTYTANVSNATSSITLTPTTADANATVTVNGNIVIGGTPSGALGLSVGSNSIVVVVTAQDGITKTTYNVSITRAAPASINASLSNISVSTGTLSPVFASGTLTYNVSVSAATTSLTLTPTTADVNATVKVNGTTTTSGTATAAIPLNVGINPISTLVTAQDGTTQLTYTVNVTRAAPSTNADLSGIALSVGTLTPVFTAGTITYTASVSNATGSITLTPTVADATAIITVNGISVSSGAATAPITLNVGPNTINAVVTAQDGVTTKTYSVVITRLSNNADLSNITLSAGTLSPVFAAATTSYSASVSNAIGSITLTPTTSDANATITINGLGVASGTASGPLSLNVGPNNISVIVTAQDGVTSKSYSLTVTRGAPLSNDANLSNLSVNTGSLSPAFATGTLSYTVAVGNATSSIIITPTTSDVNATVTVNGIAVTSGSASLPVSFPVGSTNIPVVVTAQNGIPNTYSILVTRSAPAVSSNASLAGLTISTGTLNPVFAPATTNYTTSVGNGISSITVTPTTADVNATVTINGNVITNGTASGPITLIVGSNNITVNVTAQDGATIISYSINVTRLSANNDLANLSLSAGTLSPAFSTGTLFYAASVNNSTNSVAVTPTTADPTATITVNGATVLSGSTSAGLPLNVGTNSITIIVTAQDGISNKTYTVTVTRAAPALSTNADLAGLTVSSGTLSPVFAAGTLGYTASVSNSTSSIFLTPITADANATVTVNGVPVASGSPSGAISLNIGTNPISIIVTAQDGGTTKTYNLVVTRQSSNADLANLGLSTGTLSPVFSSGTLTYIASVTNSTANITLTPTVADANATVTVNGILVNSGSASTPLTLAVGANNINTVVTAQDGATTKTYLVTVNRAAPALSTNAALSNLTISSGTLTPGFITGTTNYTASVSNATTSISLTPTTADANATVTINGTPVNSGAASGAVPLNVGTNIITTLVTAEDGATTSSYTITVTRLSSNADLSNLALSSGTLSPVFTAATIGYTASVGNGTTSITLTPSNADATATVQINGISVASGSPSGGIGLNVGLNTITAIVTAQDGSTKTYTISVTRAAAVLSTNASLSNLTLSTGTLQPAFASATLSYTASVSNATTSIKLTPTTADVNASLQINGIAVTSGTASAGIPLSVGSNIINTIVTAQDGATTKTYSITITRQSANADLSNISLSTGTLSPVFAAATIAYTASVSNATANITLTPTTADVNATVKVNGAAVVSGSSTGSIILAVGSTPITTIVTAQDGSTKTYTVIVTRAAPALSTNATLSNLSLSSGTLSPTFASGTFSYSASVSNATTTIKATPVTADVNATVKINGVTVASGSASSAIALSVGTNIITTVVTAQDGASKKTYTVTITRAASTNANLSNIALSAGTLAPVFIPATLSYSVSVANTISSIKITPTTADVNATVKVNGVPVASGAASGAIPLLVGTNTITTIVTAQDGSTKQTYTITVTRAISSNDNLSNLTLSVGTLSPIFAAGTLNYSTSVSNTTSSITVTPTAADAGATITVNLANVASNVASWPVPLTVGPNSIIVVVTAADGTTKKTYIIAVSRAASTNADLTSLTPSTGSLTPAFATGTNAYTVAVGYSTTTFTLTPTAADVTAKITVNGISVISGAASGPITLTTGNNTITTVVTAQDGITTKTYKVVVNRAALSNDATLSALTVNSGTLNPVFSSGSANYTLGVPNSITSIKVTPTTNDANATVTVNGTPVISGSASGNIALNVGAMLITISVTAQDGLTVNNYTIIVTRAIPAANANLANLSISAGTLAPVFAVGTQAYTISVNNATSSTTVTPTVEDPLATVTVNGTPIASGATSGAIALNVGTNTISVQVTAQNGTTTKSYVVTVTRGAPNLSSNADLSVLSLSTGVLSPTFSATTLLYTSAVVNAITSTTATFTTADPTATVTVNGQTVKSGTQSQPISLAVGDNAIIVIVTAQNGSSIKTYTIVVNRGPDVVSASNVFTPNGDGINDTWVIKNINIVPNCLVRVFNRAGQIVFSSIGYGVPWDGTYNSGTLPSGTYYYIIDLKAKGILSGSVVIIR